ncbi:hypothetical protein MATL_G00225800 [Megalops atlanticus]|uniref:Uncharacterized protein n=1 Tax=Megalops atlanticus TaxID=7932 RepID=A0A9D3SWL7_MEGAT|nr:hypothetical protein MATL_G00225800 [Megalops atlanticus]
MKPARAASVLLTSLLLLRTASSGDPSSHKEVRLCDFLNQLKLPKNDMKTLLETLCKAFRDCGVQDEEIKSATETAQHIHTAARPTVVTSRQSTTATGPEAGPALSKSNMQEPSMILPNAGLPVPTPRVKPELPEGERSQKSDRKMLWILLGALGALILVTIFVLKSKVLTCTKVHTYTDVAEYSEEKLYNKNDDIVLLGVTAPGSEGEDNYSCSPRASMRYDEISHDSAY